MNTTIYLLAIMGLLFFFPPLIVIGVKLARRIGREKAYGKMLRLERNRDAETNSIMLNPVIEFTDRDGQIREFKTLIPYGLKFLPQIGEDVKIYYDPDSVPVTGELASRGLWVVSSVLMLTGLLLMLPAILSLAFALK